METVRSTLPLTFDEAHARYSPAPGAGMTRAQAHAFGRRYRWHLEQLAQRVVDYITAQSAIQPVWLDQHDKQWVRLYDVDNLVRHGNQIPEHEWTAAGAVAYRARGSERNSVMLCVEWQSERVYARWFGPIRPPDWGDDLTERHRWSERQGIV